MKITSVLLVTLISSFAYSQKMLYPAVHKLNETQYKGAPKSLDGYLSGSADSKEKCTTTVAQQLIKLNHDKNAEYLKYTQAIGAKLKAADSRCNFFRFELIDYIENSAIDNRFAFRCYASANDTLPHQRVSHIDPIVINTAPLDEDEKKEKCNALSIIKRLNAQPAESAKSGGTSSKPTNAPAKTSAPSTKPAKVRTQN